MSPLRHALAFLAIAVLAVVAACSQTPPETRLRGEMATVEAALESRDAGALREVLADDFVGPDGLDRAGAVPLAQAMFLRYRNVDVVIGPLNITLQNEFPTVRFSAAPRGGSGGVLPQSAQVYEVETGWRIIDGDWRMTSARWEPRL